MTLVWRPGFMFDADASTYIEAVEAADEAASPGIGALETNTRYAINNFVIGCKQDGIWSAIKASCILAGARTLEGALVPLVGTAPTNNNFVAGDYNRETGLVGDGSTKYLNSNRNSNADPQDDRHISAIAILPDLNSRALVSARNTGVSTGATFTWHSDVHSCANGVNAEDSAGLPKATNALTFTGVSRSNSANYTIRASRANYLASRASGAPINANYGIFASNTSTNVLSAFSNARLSFYSIGESLDLAKLDARVTDLITAIGAAIP